MSAANSVLICVWSASDKTSPARRRTPSTSGISRLFLCAFVCKIQIAHTTILLRGGSVHKTLMQQRFSGPTDNRFIHGVTWTTSRDVRPGVSPIAAITRHWDRFNPA